MTTYFIMNNLNEFKPSKYQEKIFDYVLHNDGNLVIEACSGSGKTTTLIKCIELLPQDKNILFVAFNKDIVTDIEKKTKALKVDVKTVHSLGRLILCEYTNSNNIPLQSYKYVSYIRKNVYKLIDNQNLLHKKQFYNKYVKNLINLIDICRLNLCNNEQDVIEVADKYSIKLILNEPKAILKVMLWGATNLEEIDYTDMIWLPCVLPMSFNKFKYDYIFVDECQDLNKAQQKLIQNCFKLGTRGFFCGDENQSIYSFIGADKDAMNAIRHLPNTISLPLSISYRCPKKVIELANTIVKEIEPAEDAIEGKIIYNCNLDNIQDGDAILCRNNAPLLRIYTELINKDKKAVIMGKEIGANLISTLESIGVEELNANLKNDGVFSRLYKDLFDFKNFMIETYKITEEDAVNSQEFLSKLDTIDALLALSYNINTCTELIEKIHNVFSDKEQDGIILSSCHKSKGREFNNVYIACRSLMPSKNAVTEWEKKQEQNLIYVAYTRTKNILGFIDEKLFKDYLDDSQNLTKRLKEIENKISQISINFKLKEYKKNKVPMKKNKVQPNEIQPHKQETIKIKKQPNKILNLF